MQVKLEKALLNRDNKSCKEIKRIQHRALIFFVSAFDLVSKIARPQLRKIQNLQFRG